MGKRNQCIISLVWLSVLQYTFLVPSVCLFAGGVINIFILVSHPSEMGRDNDVFLVDSFFLLLVLLFCAKTCEVPKVFLSWNVTSSL